MNQDRDAIEPNDSDEGLLTRSLSRRAVVAGTAGVAAAMWAAPAITTLGAGSTAFAGSSVCSGTDWNCGDPLILCGTGGLDGICECDVDTEGNPFCWANFNCADPKATVCSSSADCTGGYRCVTQCCGQTCAPPCGTSGLSTESTGATAAGRR
jgi:hypothetical protein